MLMDSLKKSAESTAIIDESKPKQIELGPYKIRKNHKLGSGSYSKVFLCQDKSGKKAAVKILSKIGQKSSQIIKVAKAQAKILRRLDHYAINRYLGSFESQNNFYILFNYHSGQTLRDILRYKGRLEMRDVLLIIKNLLSAFQYLYSKKIMHRDIKPDNIIYNFKKATLIDFGFAYEMVKGDQETIKDWVGTPSYMSPQMLQRKKYGWKSDIWSLGVLFYELTYGILPWKGESEHHLISEIKNEELKFPQNIIVPMDLQRLISGCLEKDVEKRIGWKDLLKFQKSMLLKEGIKWEGDDNVHACYCQFLCS